jgi:RNA polymerase sigma-70 factor, ECF subfamily
VIDLESFAAQLSDCYQRLWLIAAAVTGDRAEADDIVQEASMIGLQKRADFTVGSNFVAWMSQIVRLTALNHWKKSDRRKLCLTDPQKIDQSISAGAGGSGAQSPMTDDGRLREHQADFDDDVLLALREIGETARTCLLLRVVGHLTYHDIAQTLGIPAGTAMSHVHRAKQSVRERLKTRGGQPPECCTSQGKV